MVRIVGGVEVPYGSIHGPAVQAAQAEADHALPRGTGLRQSQPAGRSPTGDRVGMGLEPRQASAPVDEGGSQELQRKLAWAVGSTYGVPYASWRSWPAEYARRAAARLQELHGSP